MNIFAFFSVFFLGKRVFPRRLLRPMSGVRGAAIQETTPGVATEGNPRCDNFAFGQDSAASVARRQHEKKLHATEHREHRRQQALAGCRLPGVFSRGKPILTRNPRRRILRGTMKSVLSILLATCVATLLWGRRDVAAQYQLAAQYQPTAQYQPPAIQRAQAPPQPAQAPPAITPAQVPEIWLMLKNGSTFSARMLSAGERVRLRVNEGDIEIRASEIALTGHSLSDLAEQQWATLHQQFLDKQIPFIDWCTRHHLYDIADTALAQMAEKGQDPPRVAGYQTRVKRLREIHQEQLAFQAAQALPAPQVAAPPPQSAMATAVTAPSQVLPAPATAPMIAPHADTFPSTTGPGTATLLLPAKPLGPATTTLPAAATSPVQPSNVQPAAYQPLEIPREQTSAAKEPAINSPHPATLPSAAVELFTARVQPWVVTRCSGCHDMQSPHSFKLERYSKQEGVTRATTLKNLAATTRLIDKDKPAESPLLVMSARAHGTSPLPPITAGDAAAMAAFREFVALATGRELPKPTKPKASSAAAPTDPTVHVTPGRATFPASAVDEPAPEDKAAAALKQTGPGWQAAIERQKAIDAEAQKLRDLQSSSQQANEARGLITDPAVQPAVSTVPPAVPATTLPLPPSMLSPSTAAATQPSLLLEPTTSVASPLTTPTTASSTTATAPAVTPPSVPQLNTLPPSPLPESLLPQSLAAKPKVDPELEAALETPPTSPTSPALKAGEGQPALPNLGDAGLAPAKPTPPINLNRPRRQFPLPPEEKPPSKGVGTGEIKRR